MKKILIVLSIFVLIAIIAIFGAYFFFKAEVKKNLIPETQKIIKDSTDLNVSFSDFEFSLANLLKLEPSIIIKDLKIEDSFSAKDIKVSFYLRELFKKKFKIKSFTINNAFANLRQKANGEVELIGLDKQNIKIKDKNKKDGETKSFLEEIELKNVEVNNSLIKLKIHNIPEAITFNNFNLKLSDFKLDKEQKLTTKLNLDTKLFNSNNSTLTASGTLGPIDKDMKTLPLNVNEKIKLSIVAIPPAILKMNLGELVQVTDAYIIQEAKLGGDFINTSTGIGRLKIENLQIGQTKEKSLIVDSDFPISFKLKSNQTPMLTLSANNSTINLKTKDNDSGKLVFDANIAMNLKSGFINGNSSGNITGIDIKNIISALTDLGNVVTGELYLENYNVSFAGSNPESLFKSAKATADIEMKNGSIYILDTITKYKNIADQVLKGLGSGINTEKISGKFKTFKANLKLENKILAVENINVEASEEQVKINGRGEVRKLQWLVFDLNLDVPKLQPIPISVRGTIEAPQVYPNLKNITKKQGEQMLNSFLQYGLDALNKNQPKTEANATAETAKKGKVGKKQSFGNLLKDTLKEGLLEAPPAPATPATQTPAPEPAATTSP